MIQGSDEWKLARCGKVTASRVSDVVAKIKTGWGASRTNYAAELIAERLTGVPVEQYQNAAMAWGSATEAEAKAAYAFLTNTDVDEVGFILHPKIEMAGASPDGLIGPDGLIEVKCPNTATHLDTLLTGALPEKYLLQIQFQMACTDRTWCDWVSYDPRLPEEMRLYIKRIERSPETIMFLEKEIGLFLIEIASKVRSLQDRYGAKAAA